MSSEIKSNTTTRFDVSLFARNADLHRQVQELRQMVKALMTEAAGLRRENATLKKALHVQESRAMQLDVELQSVKLASLTTSISPPVSVSSLSSETGNSNKENSPPRPHHHSHRLADSTKLHANFARIPQPELRPAFQEMRPVLQARDTNGRQNHQHETKAAEATKTLGKRTRRDHDEELSPAKRMKTEPDPSRPKRTKSQNRRFEQIRNEILALSTALKQMEDAARRLEEADPDDWQYRIFLMEMIEELAERHNDFDVNVLMSLRLTIKGQLTDLRSQIVRRACDMLCVVSKVMGKRFMECLVYMLPTHLTGVAISIEVIAQAHDKALTQCIINARSLKIMHNLLRNASDKRAEVKIKVISLITQLVSMCCGDESRPGAKKNMKRYLDGICETIRANIGDANPTARQCSRDLFMAFEKGFPKNSAVLLSKLDYSAQKALRKAQERAHAND